MTETTPVRAGRGMSRRRFATIVLLGMLLGAVVGTALGLIRGDSYTATSVILVAPLSGNPYSLEGRSDDLLNLETEAQLVGSDAVARAVARKEDTDALKVLAGLDVEVPPNTQILRVAYTAAEESVAVRRAQAFATAYLDARVDRGQIARKNEQNRIRAQVSQLNDRMDRLGDRILNTDNPGRRKLFQDQLTVLTTQVTELRSEYAQSRQSSADPGQIVNPAVEGSTFPVPMPVLGGFAGGFLGAFLAALGAAAVANRQSRDS
jgi:polysaccharide biosynthesis transport protein